MKRVVSEAPGGQGGRHLRLDSLNQRLLDAVNGTGEFFLSQTKLDDRLTLRVAIGNIRTTQRARRSPIGGSGRQC